MFENWRSIEKMTFEQFFHKGVEYFRLNWWKAGRANSMTFFSEREREDMVRWLKSGKA